MNQVVLTAAKQSGHLASTFKALKPKLGHRFFEFGSASVATGKPHIFPSVEMPMASNQGMILKLVSDELRKDREVVQRSAAFSKPLSDRSNAL